MTRKLRWHRNIPSHVYLPADMAAPPQNMQDQVSRARGISQMPSSLHWTEHSGME